LFHGSYFGSNFCVIDYVILELCGEFEKMKCYCVVYRCESFY